MAYYVEVNRAGGYFQIEQFKNGEIVDSWPLAF